MKFNYSWPYARFKSLDSVLNTSNPVLHISFHVLHPRPKNINLEKHENSIYQ